jgi:hypothetical protein
MAIVWSDARWLAAGRHTPWIVDHLTNANVLRARGSSERSLVDMVTAVLIDAKLSELVDERRIAQSEVMT